MTKTDLVSALAKELNLTKNKASDFVNAFLGLVTKELENGNKVSLVGFGTFEVNERGAHKGINPQTGKAMDIPAKKVPKFRPGKALKEAVNKKK